MSSSRARRIRELFHRALALDPRARRVLLERECADDPELKSDVESLLAHNPNTSELRVTPAASVPAGPRPLPERIGEYRIIRELGAGGMGIVYEAEQARPLRRVALKVIRGGVDDDVRVRLFRREIMTLARLHHPDIATIHESGQTDEGQLFYAMELVRGEPLNVQIARAFTTEGPRRELLDINLRLFHRVCAAVHFAHQHGVIHRDLKPSNILVVESSENGDSTSSGPTLPRIKVLDFGLARLSETDDGASMATEPGTVRGTLQYMSPEQVRGDPGLVDVRADVYALGLILHLVLTDRLPYDVQGVPLLDALRLICEAPTHSVLRSAAGIDPDLVVITSKALAKLPEERYESAAALGDDVARYLASLPVLARPHSTLYQLRKLVRRHRVPVAFSAILMISLVAFSVLMSVLYSRAVEAEADSSRRAETSKRTSDFLTELFQMSHPSHSRGEEVTARDLLDAGADKIDRELAAEPEVQASLQQTMGVSYLGLGLHEPAAVLLEKALATQITIHGESHLNVASVLLDLAWVQGGQGRVADAQEGARRALRIATSVGGPDHLYVGQSLELLGVIHRSLDEYAAAESTLTRARRIYETVSGPAHETVAQVDNQLANVYLSSHRYEEAESLLVRAIDIRVKTLGADHPDVGSALNNLAEVYRRQGRYEDAETSFLSALEIKKKTMGEDHPSIAFAHNNLGLLYKRMERYADAEAHLRRAVEIRRQTLPADNPLIAWTLDNLATLYVTMDRLEDAAPLFQEALSIAERSVGTETHDYAILEANRAWLFEKQGRFQASRPLREHVVAVDEKAFGPDSPRLVRNLVFLAENYEQLREFEAAEPIRRRVVAILELDDGADDETLHASKQALASLLRRMGRAHEAEAIESGLSSSGKQKSNGP